MYYVNVYDQEGPESRIIGRVQYTDNLDVWNGSNNQNGGPGHHLGITRLKREGKPFVLIYGTQWQGCKDYAVIVDDETALQEILKAEKNDLLEKYFPDYKPELEEE